MNWLPYQTSWVSEQIPKFKREVKILHHSCLKIVWSKNVYTGKSLKTNWCLWVCACGCMNCCFVVKAPTNAIMQHKQHQLGQTKMFYKIDCCVEIHGRIWMNNEPNESRIIMLSRTEISFCYIIFFNFVKFGIKPRFPVFLTHTVYSNAVVTPLRKAASYEQRKTNLGSSP